MALSKAKQKARAEKKRNLTRIRRQANAYLNLKLGKNWVRLVCKKGCASNRELLDQINEVDGTKYGSLKSWGAGNGFHLPAPKPVVRLPYVQPKRQAEKTPPDFLESWEWNTLRYKILQKFGRRCMCCGVTPEDGAKMCVDHILPRYTHPELRLDPENLQVLCFNCNKGKGAWDTTDFRP